MMRRIALPLCLSLAACHGLGKKTPKNTPLTLVGAPLATPSSELVPTTQAETQALWTQLMGNHPMPPQGAALLKDAFARNLLTGASMQASSVRADDGNQSFGPDNLTDDAPESFFAAASPTRAAMVTATLATPAALGAVVLEEVPALGARTREFILEAKTVDAPEAPWRQIAKGAEIGARRIVPLERVGRVAALRLTLAHAVDFPVLMRFSAHALPAQVAIKPDQLDFLESTVVRIECDTPGATVRYTLSGSVPTTVSPAYDPANPPVVAQTAHIRAAVETDGKMGPLEASAKVVAWDKARLRAATPFALPPERGLSYACYEGVGTLDALRAAEPVFAGGCDGLVSQARQGGGAQVCEGYLKVDGDGLFSLAVEGKVRVWVDGEQAVESDGPAARRTVALCAGWHPVRVAWLGDKAPTVKCFGPGCPDNGKIAPERWGR